MSHEYGQDYDPDDYDIERPRDSKIDEAKAVLRNELFVSDHDVVYYQRQIETRYERQFFHWITAKALNELSKEGSISSELQPLAGNAKIRFYWSPRNRYWKRRANAIRKLVMEFANSTMGHAIGRQGELMFDAALPRIGLLPVPPYRNVNSFNGRTWDRTRHDLDRVFQCDGVVYGIEIKNTLSYIERSELKVKLDICDYLGLTPLFIMRMAPKSYMHVIQKAGGFGLLFGKQLYPYGTEALATQIHSELELPVECIRDIPDGHLQRLKRWHDAQIRRRVP